MARRARSSRSGGRKARPRYTWAGFFLNGAQAPADTVEDLFVIYTADLASGKQDTDVIHQRTIGNFWCKNPATAGSVDIGFGLYLAEVDAAGAVVSDIDVLGSTLFDIRDTNWLWRGRAHMDALVSGLQAQYQHFVVDVKVKRRIRLPSILVWVVQGDQASRWTYFFDMRTLIKTSG